MSGSECFPNYLDKCSLTYTLFFEESDKQEKLSSHRSVDTAGVDLCHGASENIMDVHVGG